jgi:hypothetical protein
MLIKEKRVLVHKLLWKLGATENKPDFLKEYGALSTTDLSDDEIDHLIERLQKSIDNKFNSSKEIRYWRSCVLSLLNKCGVYVTNNDWENVNRYMLDSRICGKLLYELDVHELKTLCIKLRSIAAKKEVQNRQLLINGISMN